MEEIHKFYELFQKPKNDEKEEDKQKLFKKKFRKLSKSNIILRNQEREKRNTFLNRSNLTLKRDFSEEIQNEFNEGEEGNKEEYDYYLIKKAIYIQNKKRKRTEDVKKALEIFLYNTNFIEKLTNYLNIIESSLKKTKKFVSNKKFEDKSIEEE